MEPATAERMRAAHQHACRLLDAAPGASRGGAWGWQGRTLGRAVTIHGMAAWLRLASVPRDQTDRTFFDGNLQAQHAIPAAIPRPILRRHHDWATRRWLYRAELYDHLTQPVLARTPVPTRSHTCRPSRWWSALRTALDTVAHVATTRYTVRPGYLDWAIQTYLGIRIDTAAIDWTTAHGDLHWANITGPDLQILDWEGWGKAPAGYDAARLHAHSLPDPVLAATVRRELACHLDTPHGRITELAAIAELLHATEHGVNPELSGPLRDHAQQLLSGSRRFVGQSALARNACKPRRSVATLDTSAQRRQPGRRMGCDAND